MDIKFTDKDPRAGTVARLERERALELIAAGNAVEISENDVIVTVLKNHGPYSRGQTINVTRAKAKELEADGIVSFTGLDDGPPPVADGETAPSSASPAARVSPQKTSKPSVDGGKKPAKKKAAK